MMSLGIIRLILAFLSWGWDYSQNGTSRTNLQGRLAPGRWWIFMGDGHGISGELLLLKEHQNEVIPTAGWWVKPPLWKIIHEYWLIMVNYGLLWINCGFMIKSETWSAWWLGQNPFWKRLDFVNWDDGRNPIFLGKCQIDGSTSHHQPDMEWPMVLSWKMTLFLLTCLELWKPVKDGDSCHSYVWRRVSLPEGHWLVSGVGSPTYKWENETSPGNGDFDGRLHGIFVGYGWDLCGLTEKEGKRH